MALLLGGVGRGRMPRLLGGGERKNATGGSLWRFGLAGVLLAHGPAFEALEEGEFHFGVGGEVQSVGDVHHVLANDDVVLGGGEGLDAVLGVGQGDDRGELLLQFAEPCAVFARVSFQFGLQFLDLLLVGGRGFSLAWGEGLNKDSGNAEVSGCLLDLGKTGRAEVACVLCEFHGRGFPSGRAGGRDCPWGARAGKGSTLFAA